MKKGAESDDEIASVLNEFFAKELSVAPELLPVKKDTDLIETKILDSLSLVKTVMFIERKLGVRVPLEDMVPENFSSISSITSYLRTLRPSLK